MNRRFLALVTAAGIGGIGILSTWWAHDPTPPVPAVSVNVAAGSSARSVTTVEAGELHVEVTEAPPAEDDAGLTYRARIISESLDPVPLARLTIVDSEARPAEIADMNGNVELESVPYSFEVQVEAEGYEELRQGVVHIGGRFEPGELVLSPLLAAAIRGTVVDARGRPIPQGTVSATPPTGDPAEIRALGELLFTEGAAVGPDGTFEILEIPTGIPILLEHRYVSQTLASLEVDGLRSGEVREVRLVSVPSIQVGLRIVNAETGESLQGLTLADGNTAHGKVLYSWSGEPILGNVRSEEEEMSLQVTGDHLLLPGPGEVTVRCKARGFEEASIEAPVFPGASLTVAMKPLRLIDVELLDEHGEPLRLVRERFHSTGNEGTFWTVGSGGLPHPVIVARSPSETSDPSLANSTSARLNKGFRALDRLFSSTVELDDISLFHVYADHGEQVVDIFWLGKLVESVPVGPDEDRIRVRLNLSPAPTGGIRFRVRLADTAEEVGNYAVRLQRMEPDGRTVADIHYDVAEGEFFVERVLAGLYRLTVQTPSGRGMVSSELYWSDVEVLEGTVADLGVLSAAAAARLDLLAVDEQSNPVPGASVKVWSRDLESYARINQRSDRGPPEELRTREDGTTTPILVRGGPCRVEVGAAGFVRAFQDAHLRADEENHLLVELRRGEEYVLDAPVLELAAELTATRVLVRDADGRISYGEVSCGAGADPATIVLPGDGKIRLVFADAAGETVRETTADAGNGAISLDVGGESGGD